jgi:hypothetical protein
MRASKERSPDKPCYEKTKENHMSLLQKFGNDDDLLSEF